MIDVLLINDSTTNTNWGDRAAASALMRMVDESGGRIAHRVTEDALWTSSFAPAQPSLGDPDGDGDETAFRRVVRLCTPPGILGVRRRLMSRRPEPGGAGLIPRTWEDFEPAARAVRREQGYGWPALLDAMERAQVAVIHGASMDGAGIVPRTELFLTYILKAKLGKPVIIVNHTADLADPVLRRIAEHVYPLFDDVVFRDPISAEVSGGVCGGRFGADTAFTYEPAERDAWAVIAGRPSYFDIWPHVAGFDPARPYLCIGGSSILWSRWDPPGRVHGFATLIEALRGVYHGQIVLTASDIPDQRIFELLAFETGLPLVGVTTPVQQAVDIVGNADAYIGGRWHPAIFALRGGAPVVALSSKTFKMQSLMRAASLPERTFDALQLEGEAEELAGALFELLEAGDGFRERIRTWAAGEAARSWDNVTYLKRLAAAADG